MVPGLVEDLARVELGGLDCTDIALFGGGSDVSRAVGWEVLWYHGPVLTAKGVIDGNVDRDRSAR